MATIQPIIVTSDVDRLQAFYQRMFGAVAESRFPEEGPVFFVMLRVGDSELGLVNNDADLSAPQRFVLSVRVDDVDALLDQVEAAGGNVLGPPNDMPWGERVAHIHDPDGNKLNLTQTIGASAGR
ncbi:extradiol dioxygenase [Sphaerisporangium rufum]|uniref:Extradiol dioxygenase n=1 Tax=Sphaerisporangium rufum TaxID=1381558 RepID=A0A919R4W9_9ACTN|nr:VOC family protein [Sphaerisporangium rufum]GII78451.1 extradiol dioxygenase [Sphaerisporangium rufum]